LLEKCKSKPQIKTTMSYHCTPDEDGYSCNNNDNNNKPENNKCCQGCGDMGTYTLLVRM
jgi:hypothetical protein